MTNICIELENGKKMYAEVYEDIAPETTKHFLELVDNNFYAGLIFHRIIKNFMCQCGGYLIKDLQIMEKKCDSIRGEFASNGFENPLKHSYGVLSMARTSDTNSASSQFFICVDNCAHLDGQYASFGKLKDDSESRNTLNYLNGLLTTTVGGYFTDFPVVNELKDITIKNIYRC